MNAADVSFRVTPEVLQEKSQQIGAEVSTLRTLFSDTEQMVSNTRSFWQGEAGDAHRAAYDSQKELFSTMVNRLQEYVTDLNQIAGNYIQFEKEVKEIQDALPSDVIV